MRDPDRIDPIIDEIRDYWKAHPDMRLGQIIWNAHGYSEKAGTELFFVEDDVLMKGFRTVVKF